VTFMPMLYTLRQHIDMAREWLEKQDEQGSTGVAKDRGGGGVTGSGDR
jgi:hypothetical protein